MLQSDEQAQYANMPAVRMIRSDQIFSPDQWRATTRVSDSLGIWLVFHAWSVSALIIGVATWLAHPVAWIFAIALVGGRQLGLAILMHEAAHGLLHSNRTNNNFLGQWLTGAAVGSDLTAYRTYHLRHHKFTQQPEDPDLPLSAPFPVSQASLLRKIARDVFGVTFLKQRAAQFAIAVKGLVTFFGKRNEAADAIDPAAGTPFNQQNEGAMSLTGGNGAALVVARSLGRFLFAQLILLTLSLLLWGWTPYLLWLAALATSFQAYLRLRNIAEHACTSVGSDDPFTHARTTRAGWIARATVAPYWVNYHAEHHLFMGVPCYRLPHVHRILGERGHHPQMTIASDYGDVIRLVTASPRA